MFKLEIELGSSAMRTGDDMAGALRKVADRLSESYPDASAEWRGLSGGIKDGNGNTVGRWEVTGE